MPLERPRMLQRGVQAVLDAGLFGRSAFRSALALPEGELEQLLGVEASFFGDVGAERSTVAVRRAAGLKAVDLESGNVLEFPQRQRNGPASRSG
jgi:hypothetical protein